jgi:uncharacterized protein
MSPTLDSAGAARVKEKAHWLEIAFIMAVYLAVHFLVPGPKLVIEQLFILLVIVYLIVEGLLRHRSWADNGFSFRTIPTGFKKTWIWCLIVAFGTQALFLVIGRFLYPDLLSYAVKRAPVDVSSLTPALFITLAISTFEEEFLFRAVFQNRMGKWVAPVIAVVGVSAVFALVHISPGAALVVGVHLFSVFVDSLVFGVIFLRSRNVFVSWIPHYVADVFSILVILLLMK